MTGRMPSPGGVPAVLPTGGRLPAPTTGGRLPDPVQPAINPTPWGFVKNVVGDVGELAAGITGLVKAGVHDITAGVEELIPGQQQAEKEGYTYAKIARGFVPAILGDYQRRYGGVSNIARGLYEDPLSYVMDALVVAGGAGAVAQSGRGAGILGKLPTLVSDVTAQRILGPALEVTTNEAGQTVYRVAKYGEAPVASLESGVEALKLSKNPALRPVQRAIYRGLSQTTDAAKAAVWADTARAEATLVAAGKAGLRVLRPGVGRYLAGHETSIFLSTVRLNKNDLAQSAIAELDRLVPKDLDRDLVGSITEGLSTPTQLPVVDSPQIALQTTRRLDEVPAVGQFDPADAITLGRQYARKDISLVAPASPFAESGGGGGFNRFQIAVDSLDAAEGAANDAFRRIGARPLGVYDTLADETSSWVGLHFYGQKADGSVVELSVGTPDLLRQQAAASHVLDRVDKYASAAAVVEHEVEGLMSSLKAPLEKIVPKADELVGLKEEVYAGNQWARMIFDDTRAQWWADRGEAYDAAVKAAYRVRPWVNDNLTERWFRYFPKQASYRTLMERAYGPQRVSQFYQTMSQMAPDIRSILERAPKIGDDETYLALIHYLEDQGIPEPLVRDILGKAPWRGYRGSRDLDQATARLMKRTRGALYEHMVEEGGHGARFGFPEFDWRVMHEARLSDGLPLPTYMPNFPIKKASEYMVRSGYGNTLSRASRPATTRTWRGLLLEEGRVETDAFEAYQRAARIMVNHQETQNLIDRILHKFGRRMGPREVALARKYGDARYAGEMFISPAKAQEQLSMRSELMSDTLAGMGEHGSLQRATLDSLDDFASKVFENGINDLAGGEVWAVPKSVARVVQQEIRLQLGHNMQLFWDTPMNLWKASVLSLSPRWVVNNFFGNTIFMGIENPGAIRYAISQLDKKNRAIAEAILGPQVILETERGFFHTALTRTEQVAGEHPRLVAAAGALTGRGEGTIGRVNVVGRGIGRWSEMVRGFNSEVEEAARRGILIDAVRRQALQGWVGGFHSSYQILEKVGREGIDSRLLDRALKSVDRTLGNFMRYSPVEQGVVRRFLVPFYGFYRHMAKVMLLLPFEHPIKGRVLDLVQQMNAQMEEGLPDYLRDQGAVFLGEIMGHDTLVRLKNLNPLSQLNEDMPIVGLLNPALKVGIERSLGVDAFTGEAFNLPDDMVQTHDGRYWQIQRAGDGSIVGVVPAGKPLPSILSHIGSQFGLVGMLPTFQRYPKSTILNIASWAGLPMTQPRRSLASSAEFDQEMEQEALTIAQNQADPFASTFDTSSFKF